MQWLSISLSTVCQNTQFNKQLVFVFFSADFDVVRGGTNLHKISECQEMYSLWVKRQDIHEYLVFKLLYVFFIFVITMSLTSCVE